MFKFLALTFFIVSSAISASAIPFSPATNDTVLATRTPGVSTLEADMSSLIDRSKEFEGAVANLSPGNLTPVQMHAVQKQAAAFSKALETTKQGIKAAGTLSEADNLAVQNGFTDMKPHVVSAMKQMEPFARGEALEELRQNTARLEGMDLPIDGSPISNPVNQAIKTNRIIDSSLITSKFTVSPPPGASSHVQLFNFVVLGSFIVFSTISAAAFAVPDINNNLEGVHVSDLLWIARENFG
ncbi:hypothetical protein ONZ45_g14518 [Pleurotus djamor]|nr:hypothetical protein ONZ45_g14518 [Pleurotus djamor]